MTVQELIESERDNLQWLRAVANRHPHDADVQRLIALVAMGAAERLGKLQELAHYRDTETSHEHTNGGQP